MGHGMVSVDARQPPMPERRRCLSVDSASHLAAELERKGVAIDLDLEKVIQEVLRLGFGYTLDGAPWRAPSAYGAGVYRQGRSMVRGVGLTPAAALARALLDALNEEG